MDVKKLVQKTKILDSRLVNKTPVKGIQQTGMSITSVPFTSVSSSQSQITFNVNVPSLNTVVHREIPLTASVVLKARLIAGVATPVADTILEFKNGSQFSLNFFPLHQMINNIQLTINDCSISSNQGDIIAELARLMDTPTNRKQMTCPNKLPRLARNDVYTQYSGGNPMLGGFDAQSPDYVGNGAFHVELCSDAEGRPIGAAAAEYTVDGVTVPTLNRGINLHRAEVKDAAGAVVTSEIKLGNDIPIIAQNGFPVFLKFTSTENLRISPLLFNNIYGNECGMYGVNNLQVILSLKRPTNVFMNNIASGAHNVTIHSVDFADTKGFSNSRLDCTFITPPIDMKLPNMQVLPVMDFPRYVSNHSLGAVLEKGKTVDFQSQTITLSEIPEMVMIYVKPREKKASENDFILPIEKISINFDNFAGLLSSMNRNHLYNMSVDNGLNMDYNTYFGDISSSGGLHHAIGAPLCLRFGRDIPLQAGQSSGVLGQFSFQCNVTVKNPASNIHNYPAQTNFQLFIVAISSGYMITSNGSSQVVKSILSESDVLSTKFSGATDQDIKTAAYGGSVLSRIGDFGNYALKKAKQLGDKAVDKVADKALDYGIKKYVVGSAKAEGKRRSRKVKLSELM